MLRRLFEGYIFSIRWLLLPFILMLSIGVVGLMLKGAKNTLSIIQEIYSGKNEYMKGAVLEQIDLTLIAALVILVAISVYGNFVSTLSREGLGGKPTWMTDVDFTNLKLKLLTTLVVISAVRLLEVYMDIQRFDDRDLYFYIFMHLTLVVSRLAMGFSQQASDKG
jgi:uncharacterized protein (TIGR00645 family)